MAGFTGNTVTNNTEPTTSPSTTEAYVPSDVSQGSTTAVNPIAPVSQEQQMKDKFNNNGNTEPADISEAEKKALENFFNEVKKAFADGDLDRIGSLALEAQKVFTPETYNSFIKPEIEKLIAEAAKNKPVDFIINEILGTILGGGISGRVGIGGKNVLKDRASIPEFTLSFAETAGKGALQIVGWADEILTNFLGGIFQTFGADSHKFITEGKTLKKGDPNYEFFYKLPKWLYPIWKVQPNPDGSIQIGGRGTVGKVAEAAGNVYGLIVGPHKIFKGVNALTKGFQAKAVDELVLGAMRLVQGGRYSRASTAIANVIKNPNTILKVTNAMAANAIPLTASFSASYVAAEEFAANILEKEGITPDKVGGDQFKDLQYWFAGNYIFTYGFGLALNKYGKYVPVLRTVAGKNKFVDFMLAELGTLITIGAGTIESWGGTVEEYFDAIVKAGIDKYQGQATPRSEFGPITDKEKNKYGGGIIKKPTPYIKRKGIMRY